MKRIGKISVFLAVIATLFVACSYEGSSTDSDSSVERSANTVQALDDTAKVCHILGETVITTPDLMTLLDSKLSKQGRDCIEAWNKSLATKGDSNAELYERAINVYGNAAILHPNVISDILDEVDNPQEKDAVVKWQNGKIGQRR